MTGARTRFMERFARGVWRHLTHQDPPWAHGDYPELLATAESMLATRRKRFPELVAAGQMAAAAAATGIATFELIVADWRWIITGHGERAPLITLNDRIAALDASIATIAAIADDQRGRFTPALALQAHHVIAMRWHLTRESEVHHFAALTHEIRARIARQSAEPTPGEALRSAA